MKKVKKAKKYDKASKDLINDFEEQIIEFVIKEKHKNIEVKDRELNLPNRGNDRVADTRRKVEDFYLDFTEFEVC